jgi:type IV pilus assembly protein PilP
MPVLSARQMQASQDRAPLQRVPLGNLTLIGVVWGGFGSRAMVQTPDGKGYSVHHGTLIGPNNGVVTAISEDTITVEERVTDLYGRRLVREHVAVLGAGFGEVKDRSYRAGISRDQPSGADMASVDDLTRSARSVQFAALSNTMAAMDINSPPGAPGGYSYNPLGRRDPFAPVIRESGSSREADIALPPLQRVTLTELTLIGIIWGGFGYSAMVQTPDGKGYTVNRGTVIGPNNGVVTAISENGITVEERFTDLYGKKQVREHVIPLRLKEKAE